MGAIWDKYEPIIVNHTGFPMSYSPISLAHGQYNSITQRIAANITASPALKIWSVQDSVAGVEGSAQYSFTNGMILILTFSCTNNVAYASVSGGLKGSNAGAFLCTTADSVNHSTGGCCGHCTWAPTYTITPAP